MPLLHLERNVALTTRAYDATGFFHYWAGRWRPTAWIRWRALEVLRAGKDARPGLIDALFAQPGSAAFDGWAPSVHRNPDLGPLWNIAEPGWIPPREAAFRNAPSFTCVRARRRTCIPRRSTSTRGPVA